MAITAGMVKELREMTGAGMMDCKKALTETNGNMDEAAEFLRKNGQAKAETKAGRIAAEGLCDVIVEGTNAAIVEVNSETDFVAKNEDFKAFVHDVAKQALSTTAADMDAFMAEPWAADSGKTVKDALTDKVAVIGENLTIRRFEKVSVENGCIVDYVHGGGRIGVLVSAACASQSDEVREARKNIAMQIAAAKPTCISRDDINQDDVEKEKEILRAQALNEPKPKPAAIIEKMVNGRIEKYYKEVCLMEQAFVKDQDVSVQNMINGAFTVKSFTRFEMGEGLQKREDNFVDEVMSQTKA